MNKRERGLIEDNLDQIGELQYKIRRHLDSIEDVAARLTDDLGEFYHLGGGCRSCGSGIDDGCCDEFMVSDDEVHEIMSQDPRMGPRRLTVACEHCKKPTTFEVRFVPVEMEDK